MDDDGDGVILQVAWAIHCWSCTPCLVSRMEATAMINEEHITKKDWMMASFLVGVLGICRG